MKLKFSFKHQSVALTVSRAIVAFAASRTKQLQEALLIHLNQTKWKMASIFTLKCCQDAFHFSKSCW